MNIRLEVLIGMIGSGKTIYARSRAAQGCLVISHDDLTAMLHQQYRYEPELREAYRRMEMAIATAGIMAGRSVVVDRTHLTQEARQRWVELGKSFTVCGRPVDVIAVRFPLFAPEVHAARRFQAGARGRSHDEWFKVASHHADQADAEPLDWRAEGFTEEVVID